MKATNDKKLDVAKDILVAYISHGPEGGREVDAVCDAARRIFETVDTLVETVEGPKEQAGFRL